MDGLLHLTSSLPLVLAQYLFKMTDHSPTDWQLKGVAIAGYTVALLGRFISVREKEHVKVEEAHTVIQSSSCTIDLRITSPTESALLNSPHWYSSQ